MNSHNSYGTVLRTKGMQPFLWMQFLNAFNDNVYKLAVSLLAVLVASKGVSSGTYLSLAGFIFIAPFLLFAAYAGQLADKFEKRTVVIVTKAIEIAAMVLALFALMTGSIPWMLAVLFVTATQAALFSPAKYGIVPELVEEKQLARANGLLEMSTFVAIILGTLVGTTLIAKWRPQPAYIGAFLIGIALLGTATSLYIPHTPARLADRPFSWNPLGDVAQGMRRLRKDSVLMQAVVGTTFFWFLGALYQMMLLLFGHETLHCTDQQIGLLLASLAIGIGIGSMAAGRLSGDSVEAGLVPVGGFGMAAAGFVLAFGVHGLPGACVCLTVLGFMGGLFIVPLNAILQHRPAADEKGRVLATANFVNTIGIMAASAVVWVLHEALHLSTPTVITVAAVLTAGAAALALKLVPRLAVRLVLYVLTHMFYRIRVLGAENIPQRGPALLVANHVTYADGFLIGACTRQLVRFLVDEVWFDRFRPLFRLFDAIRVPAGNRRSVLKAIEIAREELKRGQMVCIFAEGTLTQTGNIGEFHRGLERIVSGLDVPVIPVHIGGAWGSIFSKDATASIWRSLRKLQWKITVSFGEAMFAPTAGAVRETVVELGSEAAVQDAKEETLSNRFVECAKRNWRQRAMTELSGRTLTYGEALVASELLAAKIEVSCPEQKMVGVMLPACTAGALANLAVVLSGRVVVNLNFTSGAAALQSAVEQCELRTILTSKAFLQKAKVEERPEMVFIEELVQFGRADKIRAFFKAKLLPTRFLCPRNVNGNDVAAVLFSSGSTGAPKGVMLSHRNLIANTDSVHQLFAVSKMDAIASVLPLFHAFGFTYTLWFPLLHGATAAYHPQPLDAKGLGELVLKTKATILPAPPTFCMSYLRGCSKEQFASLRFVLVGAERLNPKLAASFEEKFGVTMLEGYGATEMSPVIAVNVPNREQAGVKQIGLRPGTVGQTIPGVAYRVVSREMGERCRAGEEGLLLVKGPNRMIGYLNRAEETAAAFRGDWYVTGDIVSVDDEGFIKIVDRQSRFSKIGGEMVPHGTVEEALSAAVPGSRCAVTAVADERRGERLIAFVSEAALEPAEIWARLMNSDLPKLWIPKREDIRVIDSLPQLGTGKVDLSAVKRLALEATTAATKVA